MCIAPGILANPELQLLLFESVSTFVYVHWFRQGF
jgi:hypothetical protein